MEWVRMINIIREQAKEMIMQTLIYNGNSFIKQITIIGYGMLWFSFCISFLHGKPKWW